MGNGNIQFNIDSRSEVDMGAAKALAEGTSREEQAASWNEVLDNAVEYTGGTQTDRQQTVTDPPKTN